MLAIILTLFSLATANLPNPAKPAPPVIVHLHHRVRF